jgi:hypothetical protein
MQAYREAGAFLAIYASTNETKKITLSQLNGVDKLKILRRLKMSDLLPEVRATLTAKLWQTFVQLYDLVNSGRCLTEEEILQVRCMF